MKFKVFTFPFGKYQGETLDDIPGSYLDWCLDNLETSALLRAIEGYVNPTKLTGETMQNRIIELTSYHNGKKVLVNMARVLICESFTEGGVVGTKIDFGTEYEVCTKENLHEITAILDAK